jgi:hypothetical protein
VGGSLIILGILLYIFRIKSIAWTTTNVAAEVLIYISPLQLAYMDLSTCIYIYIHILRCVHMYIYMCIYICIYIYTYIYRHICKHTCIYVCMYKCIHILVYICISVYVNLNIQYTYIHYIGNRSIYIYTYTQI